MVPGVLLAPLEHTLDGGVGFLADVFGHLDGRALVAEAVAQFFDGIHLHVATFVAGAGIGGACDECFVGDFALEAVNHSGLGDYDEFLSGIVAAIVHHFLGAAYDVGIVADGLDAFRVGDHPGVGKFEFESFDSLLGKEDVGITGPRPELHGAAGFFADPLPEVLVGDKEDLAVGGDALHDFGGVAAGADDIAQGFDGGGAIDICHDVGVGVGVFVGCEFFGGAGVGEGTTCGEVGQIDGGLGIDDFGSLCHEVDPAENNGIAVGRFSVIGEAEGIAHVIGDPLDRFDLIIVGENDGVAFLFQGEDFFLNRIEGRFLSGAGSENHRFVVERSGSHSGASF